MNQVLLHGEAEVSKGWRGESGWMGGLMGLTCAPLRSGLWDVIFGAPSILPPAPGPATTAHCCRQARHHAVHWEPAHR